MSRRSNSTLHAPHPLDAALNHACADGASDDAEDVDDDVENLLHLHGVHVHRFWVLRFVKFVKFLRFVKFIKFSRCSRLPFNFTMQKYEELKKQRPLLALVDPCWFLLFYGSPK